MGRGVRAGLLQAGRACSQRPGEEEDGTQLLCELNAKRAGANAHGCGSQLHCLYKNLFFAQENARAKAATV